MAYLFVEGSPYLNYNAPIHIRRLRVSQGLNKTDIIPGRQEGIDDIMARLF